MRCSTTGDFVSQFIHCTIRQHGRRRLNTCRAGVDGRENFEIIDGLSGVRVISNYGVGVDHIDLADAAVRGIPVGNTPGILNGATADMALTLLLATGRRLIEGDRYARSPEFKTYDPGYLLRREIHGQTLGIVGMGRMAEMSVENLLRGLAGQPLVNEVTASVTYPR
ncbi:MAG: NAD(P)-dependent oxidoreductase [Pirellulaceae bacterium]|nr:NAD(P)-dependent oxidoreductase [Pirellulaceae bacterium]MDP7301897.1 NAD(P)-dependent oxidoreductase [Pirellulaceae bacterium]HJN09161.1 NAD(P)-dependent oxidoreductase [Pirellulaceae bacterium]